MEEEIYIENIIIGGGPAGIQLSIFLEEKYKHNQYLLIESGNHPGTFFQQYPRSRKLISINRIHSYSAPNLRYDWNSLLFHTDEPIQFCDFSEDFYPQADSLVNYLKQIVDKKNINIQYNTQVISIIKNNTGLFCIECIQNNHKIIYLCEKLFIATGLIPKIIPSSIEKIAHKLNIQLHHYKQFEINNPIYKNKNILIVGSGNASFEVSNSLINLCKSIAIVGPCKFAWKTHYPGHIRSNNMAFIDTLYLKMGNIIYMNDYSAEQAIVYQHDFLNAQQSQLDYIIYCGGFTFDKSIFKSNCIPSIMQNGFPYLDSSYQSINVKNLYFIGTLMQGHDYKEGTSAFIHGFRYNIEFLDKYIHNNILPIEIKTKNELIKHIQSRINHSSCLHHRFRYFCDYILIIDNETLDTCYYYEGIPIDFLNTHSSLFHKSDIYKNSYHSSIILKMDYGDKPFDWSIKQPGGFSQSDIVIPFRDAISKFLHPILTIQHYKHSPYISKTWHIGESPTGQFYHFIYQTLLHAFIQYAYSIGGDKYMCDVEKQIIETYWKYSEHIKSILC